MSPCISNSARQVTSTHTTHPLPAQQKMCLIWNAFIHHCSLHSYNVKIDLDFLLNVLDMLTCFYDVDPYEIYPLTIFSILSQCCDAPYCTFGHWFRLCALITVEYNLSSWGHGRLCYSRSSQHWFTGLFLQPHFRWSCFHLSEWAKLMGGALLPSWWGTPPSVCTIN